MNKGPLAALVPFAVLLAACTSTTSGNPVTSAAGSTTPSAAAFDPCTAITAEQLTAAGLDAARGSEPYDAGTGDTTEKGCSWWAVGGNAANFTADIGVGSRTADEYLNNPSFTSSDEQVAGRRVVNFQSSPDQPDCDYAVETPGGSAIIAITPVGTQFLRDQACAAATQVLTSIAPSIP